MRVIKQCRIAITKRLQPSGYKQDSSMLVLFKYLTIFYIIIIKILLFQLMDFSGWFSECYLTNFLQQQRTLAATLVNVNIRISRYCKYP